MEYIVFKARIDLIEQSIELVYDNKNRLYIHIKYYV